jgi:hypothetical protein
MTEWIDVESLEDPSDVIGKRIFLRIQDNNDFFFIPCKVLSISREYGNTRAALEDDTGKTFKKAISKLVMPRS